MNDTTLPADAPQQLPFAANDPVRHQMSQATAQNMPAPQPAAPAPTPQPLANGYSVPDSIASDPAVNSFTATMRALDMPSDLVQGSLTWFADNVPHDGFQRMDAEHRQQVETELRQIWQGDYDKNLATVREYLNGGTLPEGVGDMIQDARLQDGRRLVHDSSTLARLLGQAKRSAMLPKVSGDVDAQIKQLEGYMRRDRAKYNKDEPAQMKLRSLYAAREASRA